MNTTTRTAIRLSITPEVDKALRQAKRLYPTLSDPEILKLGLSKIITENQFTTQKHERDDIRKAAARSVGQDYLSDPEEDIYAQYTGKQVDFS